MSFVNLAFLPLIMIVFSLFVMFYLKHESKAFLFIEKYWFYRRTNKNKISAVFFIFSILLFLISLLDLRGPSKSLKTTVPDQKTIIIIDNSSSMLAEDVRPNRFLKSLLMARHFVKSAYGHQIAVVLFSDVQKRIIPFTDDLELLDSRIEALENKNISKGGSNVGQAISESVQYFKEASKTIDSPTGNILLFTDSDETRINFDVKVPDGISLAVVAVATRSGGPIPMKDQQGNFYGYKTFRGQKVISKLDESFLKELKDKVKNYRYWEISTYNLPTDEIISFFNSLFKRKISERNMDVRPVLTQYIVIFAILLYVVSVILSRGKNLTLALFLIFIPFLNSRGAETDTEKLMGKLKSGSLKREEILKLAEKLLKEQKAKEASILYEENRPLTRIESSINQGTALVGAGNFERGLEQYRNLMENLEKSSISGKESLLNVLRNNVIAALTKQEQDKQKKDKENKEQKDKNDSSKQDQGEGKNQKQNQDKGKEGEKDQNQNKQNGNDEKKDEKESKEEDPLKKKEDEIKQERGKNKIPAMLKQILDDDRKLQQIYIDTSTQKKDQNDEVKDW